MSFKAHDAGLRRGPRPQTFHHSGAGAGAQAGRAVGRPGDADPQPAGGAAHRRGRSPGRRRQLARASGISRRSNRSPTARRSPSRCEAPRPMPSRPAGAAPSATRRPSSSARARGSDSRDPTAESPLPPPRRPTERSRHSAAIADGCSGTGRGPFAVSWTAGRRPRPAARPPPPHQSRSRRRPRLLAGRARRPAAICSACVRR